MPRSRELTISQEKTRWSLAALSFPRLGIGFSDIAAASLAAAAAIAILINALVLQPGPHPAPLFVGKPVKIAAEPAANPVTALPRPRPSEAEPARPATTSNARSKAEIVTEIQKELARKGFYDGVADGVLGPKTDTALRDFEKAAGLRALGEVGEGVLKTILQSTVRATTSSLKRAETASEPAAPVKQVAAVQRALTDFGYGQIKPTGVVDSGTRVAIEKFERERKLPVSGQISDRFVRELASITGRTLN